MNTSRLTERVAGIDDFRAVKAAGLKLPFWPQHFAHVYVKLDFEQSSENSTTIDDARGYLRSVARASMAADKIAQQYGGLLLEVQGSMLHVGLVDRRDTVLLDSPHAAIIDTAKAFATDLHWAFHRLFHDKQKRVQGWRMAIDAGKTLIVTGRGVHNDDSYVSLGRSANRPAKHLYAQLAITNEEDRELKRFHVGVRRVTQATGEWDHFNLDTTSSRLAALTEIAEAARHAEPTITFLEASTGWKEVSAMALPIAPAGDPGSPSPDQPHTYFGWVMRADLDGFTARVEGCFDNDQQLQQLGEQFYCIMDAAADFTERHRETMAQLPWAGDNFTAAAVFSAKDAYDAALPKRLVELTLDFEKEMAAAAVECGFGGWAYGVAGGEPHGNATGNVFLAGVDVAGRRFLVGVGEGFGRSIRAFGDINPTASQIVVYAPDWHRMHEPYRDLFQAVTTVRHEVSSLYRLSGVEKLQKVRLRQASVAVATPITFKQGPAREVSTRPYHG